MKDSRITLRLPAELRRRVKSAANRYKMLESDFIRLALERQLAALENERTAYDAALKSGIIGIVEGPEDLSTNPRYMDGFGKS